MATGKPVERSQLGRRGRPIAGTEQARRERVLDAALSQLVEAGADQLTMAAIAKRAAASKETLYRWFGDRERLLAALIQRNADRSAARIEDRLNAGGHSQTPPEFRETLVDYSVGLLTLLTGEPSVALNRAAMNDRALRPLLLQQGRHRVGPIVERLLRQGAEAGLLAIDRVGGETGAFELLYGLVVRDTQIRVLLGEPPPTPEQISARAEDAVGSFLTLCAATEGPPPRWAGPT